MIRNKNIIVNLKTLLLYFRIEITLRDHFEKAIMLC